MLLISMVKEITDETFDEFVGNNDMVVVDCWAAWCGPCRILSPIVEKLSMENADIAFGKLDVDQNMKVPRKYGIRGIPTLLYFKGGNLVNKTVGVMPKKRYEDALDKLRK